MRFQDAMAILAQHNQTTPLQPVCVVHKSNGLIDGQLPTGNQNIPFISINDNLVTLQDVLEVLEDTPSPSQEVEEGAGRHHNNPSNPTSFFVPSYTYDFDPFSYV
jgi:hypothetical protein